MDTTRLQPVVLQLYGSTSLKQDAGQLPGLGPCCFNMAASKFKAEKLKYHRLKPRGVRPWFRVLSS